MGTRKSERPQGEAEAALWLVINLTLGPSYLLDPLSAIPQGEMARPTFPLGFSMPLGYKDGPEERKQENLTWVSSWLG